MSKPVKILSHNYTGQSLVVVYVGDKGVQTKIVESSHPNWHQIVANYRLGQYEAMVPLFDMSLAIEAKFKGAFQVSNGKVTYKGNVVHGYLIDRILFQMRERLPSQRLVNFAENVYLNPSPTAREELYKFLEHKHMPITEDGCFMGYKGVGKDYYSRTGGSIKVLKGKVKDGRIYNGVGEDIIVERKDVCGDQNVGCAAGLHVGSFDYANDFKSDGHLMVVKVNPRDVVSVPHDCSWQKLRTCRYLVIAEEGGRLSDVRDINYDKVAELRYHNQRDSKGRFAATTPKFTRDSLGRFCS
jgi:hypothetical protein